MGPDIPKTTMCIENGKQPGQDWSKTVLKLKCMMRALLYMVVPPLSRACEKSLMKKGRFSPQGFLRKEKKESIMIFLFLIPGVEKHKEMT